ncbi:hypothetical protein PsYK624_170960 [Phanerochaete sordida]|uniref:Uncharacterized protein n=1 Tax=Phanerochaete sordida TaxID=48140 RepID=A0A9P3LP34_9APHY|nr:hypothetical protein PsYK624_170960 [Phanerochaete sordida]
MAPTIDSSLPSVTPTTVEELKSSVVRTIEEFVARSLTHAEGAATPIASSELVASRDVTFIRHCRITYPAATELLLLHLVLTCEEHPVERVDLWTTALKHGLPFRPLFTADYSQWIIDKHRERILEHETPLLARNPKSPFNYYVAWVRAGERIASYPQFCRLFFYGGLVWRLAILFGGNARVADALASPSGAWIAYERGTVGEPADRLYSEVYDDLADDPLVAVLLGTFEGRLTLWPPPHVVMLSFRWPGSWTASLEGWFLKHVGLLCDRQAGPQGDAHWKNNFARGPSVLRRMGPIRSASELATPVVQEARSSGLFEETLAHELERVEWDPTCSLA